MSLLTQRDPCRLPAWLGRTINMLYRTCRAPVHSITQPRQGTGDWVLPASAQGHARVGIDARCKKNGWCCHALAPRAWHRCLHVASDPADGPRRPSPCLHTYIYTSGPAAAPARGPWPAFIHTYTLQVRPRAGPRPRAGVRSAFIHTYTLQVRPRAGPGPRPRSPCLHTYIYTSGLAFIHTYTLQVRPREPADFKRTQP